VAARGAHLFPVRQATIINYWADVSTAAHGIYAAENPMEGAMFTYHLGQAAQSVKFTVTNATGRVIRELTGPTTAGTAHRINWDLRYPPTAGGPGGGGGGGEEGIPPGMQGGRTSGRQALPIPAHNIGPRGFYVSPGTYTVTMDVDGTKSRQTFTVRGDPTSTITVAEHQAREAFLLEAQEVQAKLTEGIAQFRAKLGGASAADSARYAPLVQKLGMAPAAAGRGPGGGGGFGRPRGPVAALAALPGAWNGSGARHGGLQAPTGTHRKVLSDAKAALAELQRALAAR
ncbi:MAG: hypothetical protein JNJ98_07540, partial [Gemmatimonadetes bacterium]|nr:hypothetical protein [Gemmatimonadota bacterium]